MHHKIFIRGLLGLLLCLPLGCGEKIEPGTTAVTPSPMVKAAVATAQLSSRPLVYEAVGTVRAHTASTLASKLLGTVKQVRVQEGDRVKARDILVVLDGRQVTSQLHQAEAVMAEAAKAEAAAVSAREAAAAGADLAKATYNRYLRLMEDESASRQEFEEIEARHRQAQAAGAQADAMVSAASQRVRQAQAAVAAARVTQNDIKISAPYNGIVTARMVEPGDLAAPGTPLLSLQKTGAYRVEMVLPETHLQSVRLDQKLAVHIPALHGPAVEGTVAAVFPAADHQSRSFLVKVDLPENPALRSGMFARVDIPLMQAGMLVIPSSAVVFQGQLTGIYILDADRIARFRLIRIGRTLGDSLEVLSGLAAGVRFVVKPGPKIVDGARVEVVS